jgi:O-acetyl-ADP-ribose deacetylase (regulator of RNase III)
MKKVYELSQGAVEIMDGDLTELSVDAIVNAANEHLILGGGVAGVIRQKGGPSIQEECNQIGGTYVGGAVLTNAGNLPANYVIHAVGPRMGEGDEDIKLQNATRNSLIIATEKQLDSIAFPAISTGIFGFPVLRCAQIMTEVSVLYLKEHHIPRKVIFCLWGEKNYKVFEELMDGLV